MSSSRKLAAMNRVLKTKQNFRLKDYFLNPKYLVVIIIIVSTLKYCDFIMHWLPESDVTGVILGPFTPSFRVNAATTLR